MTTAATGSITIPTVGEGSAAGRQTLNAADRLMLVGHESLRKIGHSGFQCQTHVWLKGRLDVAKLRVALSKLRDRYPVITSRLDGSFDSHGPYWRFRPDADVELTQAALDQSDPSAVWRYGEKLFTDPLDHDGADPISFHLLHLPNGGDVFLLRYGHALMDGKAPEFVLKEINRCIAESDPSNEPFTGDVVGSSASDVSHAPRQHPEDEMNAHLYRFGRRRRLRAALRVVGSHVRWPVKSVTLVPPDRCDWQFVPFRMAVRSLNEADTQSLVSHIRRLCGFTNLSPAVLACVFRSVNRLSLHRKTGSTCFQTDVPLNLRPPGRSQPIFRNFMSFIQMRASGSQLKNRDDLIRLLNTQMRDQLRLGIDLGNLQMMTMMSRHDRLLRKHLAERMKSHPFTLGFGFLGPVSDGLEQFCGQPVDWLYTLNTAISPPGITLQVNQHRGRINLALTYVSETVPDSLASAFLDAIIEDLVYK